MMSETNADFSMSTLSLNSIGSQNEDWDRSESDIQTINYESAHKPMTTPRNSVVFPADEVERTPVRGVTSKGGRTLSELLKLHAETGTEGRFSQEEASRVVEVLGQWVSVRPMTCKFQYDMRDPVARCCPNFRVNMTCTDCLISSR